MSSILESPELCHALSPYLCSHDIAHCIRLSNVSHRVWFPYLWRHIEFGDFRIYLADLLPDLHRNGIPHPPPSTSVPRQRRLSPEMERERALSVEAATAAYLTRIRSPPYEQLLRHGHLVQLMTIHVDESDGPYSSPYTNPEIVENLKGQVRRRVFITLIEKAGSNLRALEIKGFNTLQPDRPQLGECGNAAMWRSVQRADQWALDKVVACLITTAARIASSSATTTSNPTDIPTQTFTTSNGADKSGDRRPSTYSSNQRGLRFLTLSCMLGVSNHTIDAITKIFSTDGSTLEHIDIQYCGRIQSQHIRPEWVC